MARAVLHVELPGIHVAAAVELGLVAAGAPVVVHRRERVVDRAGVAWLKRGQPLRAAQQMVPEATFLPVGALAGAETYRVVWDRFQTIGPTIEPTSWQAGYIDVTGCLPRRGVEAHLAALAKRLAAETGQPPARGVGDSKLIARHASPLGRVVPASEAVGFLHQQKLRPDPSLTRPMIEMLTELGCHTWGMVAEVPESRLRGLFGVRGLILHRWSQGVDPRPVRPRYPPPLETARQEVEPDGEGRWIGAFAPLAETLMSRLRRRGEAAQEVVLALGGRSGWWSYRRTLSRPLSDPQRLHTVLLGLLPLDIDPWSVDEIRVTLRGLRAANTVQGVLFRDEHEERRERLDEALCRVRERFGLLSLGHGPEVVPPRERLAEAVWRLEKEE